MSEQENISSSFVFGITINGDGSGSEFTDPYAVPLEENYWLHGDFQGEDCIPWLKSLSVPETIIETMVRPESRPRVITNQFGTLLLIRAINLNPGESPEDMVSLRLWIQPNRVISIRHRLVYSVQDIRKHLNNGDGPSSIQELLTSILEKVADRVSDYVETLEELLDGYEASIDQLNPSETRSRIANLRHQIVTVKRYLAPQREALDNFYRQSHHLLDDVHQYQLHDQTDRIIRYVEDLDLAKEQSQLLLEELANRVAQEQNARMYVLSIIAAIFLPISFITGLFGMNVGGLPGLDSPGGFLAVCGLMALIGGGIISYFRYKRWL